MQPRTARVPLTVLPENSQLLGCVFPRACAQETALRRAFSDQGRACRRGKWSRDVAHVFFASQKASSHVRNADYRHRIAPVQSRGDNSLGEIRMRGNIGMQPPLRLAQSAISGARMPRGSVVLRAGAGDIESACIYFQNSRYRAGARGYREPLVCLSKPIRGIVGTSSQASILRQRSGVSSATVGRTWGGRGSSLLARPLTIFPAPASWDAKTSSAAGGNPTPPPPLCSLDRDSVLSPAPSHCPSSKPSLLDRQYAGRTSR